MPFNFDELPRDAQQAFFAKLDAAREARRGRGRKRGKVTTEELKRAADKYQAELSERRAVDRWVEEQLKYATGAEVSLLEAVRDVAGTPKDEEGRREMIGLVWDAVEAMADATPATDESFDEREPLEESLPEPLPRGITDRASERGFTDYNSERWERRLAMSRRPGTRNRVHYDPETGQLVVPFHTDELTEPGVRLLRLFSKRIQTAARVCYKALKEKLKPLAVQLAKEAGEGFFLGKKSRIYERVKAQIVETFSKNFVTEQIDVHLDLAAGEAGNIYARARLRLPGKWREAAMKWVAGRLKAELDRYGPEKWREILFDILKEKTEGSGQAGPRTVETEGGKPKWLVDIIRSVNRSLVQFYRAHSADLKRELGEFNYRNLVKKAEEMLKGRGVWLRYERRW